MPEQSFRKGSLALAGRTGRLQKAERQPRMVISGPSRERIAKSQNMGDQREGEDRRTSGPWTERRKRGGSGDGGRD